MKKITIFLAAIHLAVIGCSKIPENIESAGIKIEIIKLNDKTDYSVRIIGGIKNDNINTAFVNFKGKLLLIDPKQGDKIVDTIPFELPVILPFASGIIDKTVSRPEDKINDIIKLLGASRDNLIKNGSIEKFDIGSQVAKLDIVSYKKKDIIDLLKDRADEKN